MSEDFVTGQVKWFNQEKGYGFIKMPGDGLDVFVHANQLRKSGIDRFLRDGETVKFQSQRGEKGAFAVNISIVRDDAKPAPDTTS